MFLTVAAKHERFGALCSPIFSTLAAIGFLAFAHFWDPARPSLSPDGTAAWYQHHHDGVLVGMAIFLVAIAFLTVWSAQLSIHLWRIPGQSPLLALSQAMAGGIIVMVVLLDSTLWIGAAFRPGMNGEIVQALNDSAWFSYMMAWPIFAVQMLATAVLALNDKRSVKLFPRWLEHTSIFLAIAGMTSMGIAFTKHGVFCYHGLLGYYFGMAIWLFWNDTHAWYAFTAPRRGVSLETVALRSTVEGSFSVTSDDEAVGVPAHS
jgi:hypothetical protein